jgi:DNA-binding MarR family transcriptional regulator
MRKPSTTLTFFIQLAKIQTIMSRRFDARLGGLGFNEFLIMLYLDQAADGKMRRIDLAEKLGLTASGITRILLPMEKVGYIKRETNEHDARSSFVVLAPGGKEKLDEGLERAENFMEDLITPAKTQRLKELSEVLGELSGGIM